MELVGFWSRIFKLCLKLARTWIGMSCIVILFALVICGFSGCIFVQMYSYYYTRFNLKCKWKWHFNLFYLKNCLRKVFFFLHALNHIHRYILLLSHTHNIQFWQDKFARKLPHGLWLTPHEVWQCRCSFTLNPTFSFLQLSSSHFLANLNELVVFHFVWAKKAK